MKRKLIYLFLIVVVIGLLSATFFGCDKIISVESVTINSTSNEAIEYEVDAFNYDNYTITVKYSDGSSQTVNLTPDMISESDKLKFHKAGKFTISATYEGKTVTFDVIMKIKTIDEDENADPYLEDASFVYDGKNHSIEVKGLLPNGAEIYYPQGNSFSKVGIYTVTAIITAENYAAKTLTARLAITKATYDTSDVSINVNYGTEYVALTEDELNKKSENYYEGVKYVKSINGAYSLYDISVNYKDIKKYDGNLYKIQDCKSYTYSGNEYTPYVSGNIPDGLKYSIYYSTSSDTFSYDTCIKGNAVKDAGTYYFFMVMTGDDVGVNYKTNDEVLKDDPDSENTLIKSTTMVIKRQKLGKQDDLNLITFEDKTYVYDGKVHRITISNNVELVGMHVEYVDDDDETFGTRTDAGVYNITAKFMLDNDINYQLDQDLHAVLTILRADYKTSNIKFELPSGKALYAKDFTATSPQVLTTNFDGTNQIPAVTEIPAGLTFSHYTLNSADGEVITNITNAGTYVLYAHFVNSDTNYNDVDPLLVTLTVNKVAFSGLDIEFNDEELEYDDNTHAKACKVNSLPVGVTTEMYYIDPQGVKHDGLVQDAKAVGTYECTIRYIFNASNYTDANIVATKTSYLKIKKREFDAATNVIVRGSEKKADGQDYINVLCTYTINNKPSYIYNERIVLHVQNSEGEDVTEMIHADYYTYWYEVKYFNGLSDVSAYSNKAEIHLYGTGIKENTNFVFEYDNTFTYGDADKDTKPTVSFIGNITNGKYYIASYTYLAPGASSDDAVTLTKPTDEEVAVYSKCAGSHTYRVKVSALDFESETFTVPATVNQQTIIINNDAMSLITKENKTVTYNGKSQVKECYSFAKVTDENSLLRFVDVEPCFESSTDKVKNGEDGIDAGIYTYYLALKTNDVNYKIGYDTDDLPYKENSVKEKTEFTLTINKYAHTFTTNTDYIHFGGENTLDNQLIMIEHYSNFSEIDSKYPNNGRFILHELKLNDNSNTDSLIMGSQKYYNILKKFCGDNSEGKYLLQVYYNFAYNTDTFSIDFNSNYKDGDYGFIYNALLNGKYTLLKRTTTEITTIMTGETLDKINAELESASYATDICSYYIFAEINESISFSVSGFESTSFSGLLFYVNMNKMELDENPGYAVKTWTDDDNNVIGTLNISDEVYNSSIDNYTIVKGFEKFEPSLITFKEYELSCDLSLLSFDIFKDYSSYEKAVLNQDGVVDGTVLYVSLDGATIRQYSLTKTNNDRGPYANLTRNEGDDITRSGIYYVFIEYNDDLIPGGYNKYCVYRYTVETNTFEVDKSFQFNNLNLYGVEGYEYPTIPEFNDAIVLYASVQVDTYKKYAMNLYTKDYDTYYYGSWAFNILSSNNSFKYYMQKMGYFSVKAYNMAYDENTGKYIADQDITDNVYILNNETLSDSNVTAKHMYCGVKGENNSFMAQCGYYYMVFDSGCDDIDVRYVSSSTNVTCSKLVICCTVTPLNPKSAYNVVNYYNTSNNSIGSSAGYALDQYLPYLSYSWNGGTYSYKIPDYTAEYEDDSNDYKQNSIYYISANRSYGRLYESIVCKDKDGNVCTPDTISVTPTVSALKYVEIPDYTFDVTLSKQYFAGRSFTGVKAKIWISSYKFDIRDYVSYATNNKTYSLPSGVGAEYNGSDRRVALGQLVTTYDPFYVQDYLKSKGISAKGAAYVLEHNVGGYVGNASSSSLFLAEGYATEPGTYTLRPFFYYDGVDFDKDYGNVIYFYCGIEYYGADGESNNGCLGRGDLYDNFTKENLSNHSLSGLTFDDDDISGLSDLKVEGSIVAQKIKIYGSSIFTENATQINLEYNTSGDRRFASVVDLMKYCATESQGITPFKYFPFDDEGIYDKYIYYCISESGVTYYKRTGSSYTSVSNISDPGTYYVKIMYDNYREAYRKYYILCQCDEEGNFLYNADGSVKEYSTNTSGGAFPYIQINISKKIIEKSEFDRFNPGVEITDDAKIKDIVSLIENNGTVEYNKDTSYTMQGVVAKYIPSLGRIYNLAGASSSFYGDFNYASTPMVSFSDGKYYNMSGVCTTLSSSATEFSDAGDYICSIYINLGEDNTFIVEGETLYFSDYVMLSDGSTEISFQVRFTIAPKETTSLGYLEDIDKLDYYASEHQFFSYDYYRSNLTVDYTPGQHDGSKINLGDDSIYYNNNIYNVIYVKSADIGSGYLCFNLNNISDSIASLDVSSTISINILDGGGNNGIFYDDRVDGCLNIEVNYLIEKKSCEMKLCFNLTANNNYKLTDDGTFIITYYINYI